MTCQPRGPGSVSFQARLLGYLSQSRFAHSIHNQPSLRATRGPGLEESFRCSSKAAAKLSSLSVMLSLIKIQASCRCERQHIALFTCVHAHISAAWLGYYISLKAIIVRFLTDLFSNICTHFITITEHYI